MTVSSLGGVFAKVNVSVQSDYRQVSVITSLGKEIIDSRVLGRGRHQVVQDSRVVFGDRSRDRVQIGRDASDEFHPRNHRPTYLIIERLPSLVQPDDSLRRWHHHGATVL